MVGPNSEMWSLFSSNPVPTPFSTIMFGFHGSFSSTLAGSVPPVTGIVAMTRIDATAGSAAAGKGTSA